MPPRKCTYLVRGRVCGKPAHGNPPLCDPHAEELEGPGTGDEMVDEMLEDVFDNPKVQGFLGKVASFIDQTAYIVDRAVTPKTPTERREAVRDAFHASQGAARRVADAARPKPANGHQAPPRRPPPPVIPRRPVGEDPMIVLGFAPGTKLTADVVKARYKQLAQIYHSDKGGSDESMKRLNAARDALLARCKSNR